MLGACNLCGFPVLRLPVRLLPARCAYCRSSQIHRAVGIVLGQLPCSAEDAVYELSSRGALHRFLQRKFKHFYCSEYFDEVPPGQSKAGIDCQDVQRLLLAAETFDLVTSTEVFEHVPDDRQGFREVRRVLKPGGHFVFTVPLGGFPATLERCRIREDGTQEHLLPPEYHGDRIRGRRAVLAFRDYGRNIVNRLQECGFSAQVRVVTSQRHRIQSQPVLVAQKAAR